MESIVGLLGILMMFALMFLGIPIAISMIIPSFLGFTLLLGWEAALSNVASIMTEFISDYTMSVIPVFIYMGQLGYSTKILSDVYSVAQKWLGRLPGGLAISTVFANGIFGACSGSSIAACIVIGRTAIPEMEKNGYPPVLTYGIVTAAGTLAALIPPSILMCIYGLLVDVSIADIYIAGFLPGFVSIVLYCTVIILYSRYKHMSRSNIINYSFMEKLRSIGSLWVVFLLILGIMVSLYWGWATPTEVGAVGAVVIFFLALMTGRVSVSILWESLTSTIKSCGAILLILCAAAFFGRFLVLTGITELIVDSILRVEMDRYIIFTMIVFIYLFLGCFMSAAAMLVVSLPIFYPIMMKLGFDPVWFGIIVVICAEMALITPPVGINLYTVSSIAPKIPIETIIKGASMFLIVDILTIVILTVFPEIATILPTLMHR